MAEDRPSKVVAIPTPEGAAYYPFGSWGRGYVLDAPARAALDTYLRRIIWIILPILPVSDLIGSRLGVDNVVSGLVGLLVFCAINTAVTLYILRRCRMTAMRTTSEELLRRSIEQRGHPAVETSCWCGLIVSAGVTAAVCLIATGLERLIFASPELALVGFSVLQLWRVKRLDAV